MNKQLLRVGTCYIPVQDVRRSVEWYQKIGGTLNYQDEEKAILDMANQSFFLVKSSESQSANFIDSKDREHFSLTFEVDGLDSLKELHADFRKLGIETGEIEDRGHPGKNFTFSDPDGNRFDVWSELSPLFKEKFMNENDKKSIQK